MIFKSEITDIVASVTNLDQDEVYNLLEVPPSSQMGDYAFPCFRFAKEYKKAPHIIAKSFVDKIDKPYFLDKIDCISGYINFFINKKIMAEEVLGKIYEENLDYGKSKIGTDKTILIDYSSPNIAKPFHVGHLRSTVIGNALYNIYRFLGYKCVGINHLGDWGTQFGKLIVAYNYWSSKELVEEKGIEELMRIYVKFHDEAGDNPMLEDDARNWFVKMQEGDTESLVLWKWFYDISMKEFEKIYDMLGVSFDSYAGESFYNDKMDSVVEEINGKNLLLESEGALIVDLEKENMPPCLIIRKDGGTLYATRDITAALYRKKTYDFERCLYLTALDQNLHFAQFFKVIEKMGYEWAKDSLVHVPFGLVSLESGKLSTRKGNIVLMEELLDEAVKETAKIIETKNPDLPNKNSVAKDVGIGAVIFNDLYNGRIKDVTFSWSKMLSFEGETGPYVQYTHARACNVIKKSGYDKKDLANINFGLLDDVLSTEIIRILDRFPEKIYEASIKYEPSIISRCLMELSQAFNKFYHDNPIINSEDELKKARLILVFSVKAVLQTGLSILGIKAPEEM